MRVFLLYIVLFFAIGSCKKYPEDNKLHFNTVKYRLCGKASKKSKSWMPIYAHNSVSNTDTYFSPSDVIYFFRDGGFGGYLCCNYFNYSGVFVPANSYNFKGTWDFIDKKNKLEIIDANGVSGEFSISKLNKDELWLQNDSMLFKFTPQPEKTY